MDICRMRNTMTHGSGYSKWTDILDKYVQAPEEGLYVVACRGDNHVYYTFFYLKKDQYIYEVYYRVVFHKTIPVSEISEDYSRWDIPISYHYIPIYEPDSNLWKSIDSPLSDNLYGIIACAMKYKENVYYYCHEVHKGECQFDFSYGSLYANDISPFDAYYDPDSRQSIAFDKEDKREVNMDEEGPDKIEILGYHFCFMWQNCSFDSKV